MGDQAARQIESGARIVTGPVSDWVNAIGERLAAASDSEFKYSFVVVDSDDVNAFALPGGYVYVYTGLRKVAQTDSELAAVLAHEITHAEQHHFARQYKKASKRGFALSILSMAVGLPNLAQEALGLVDFALTQRYSREHESEADRLGMKRMVRAGFDPQGMVSLLDKLNKDSQKGDVFNKWFGDHPDGPRRIANAQAELTELKTLESQHDPTVKPLFAPWRESGTAAP